MKNKNKKAIFYFSLFLSIGFFGFDFWKSSVSAIVISDLVVEEAKHDVGGSNWIKVYNSSKVDIIIAKGKLGITDENTLTINKSGSNYLGCHGAKNKTIDLIFPSEGFVIIASDEMKFLEKNTENKYPIFEAALDNSKPDKNYIRISADKCSVEKPKVEPKDYPAGIRLNEILPNPSGSGEEYIEIFNGSAEDVDLEGWILRDGSKTGKYVFPESLILESSEFLAVYKKDFKFALNDSGAEAVRLLDPSEKEVAVVNYLGAKDGLSFGIDGAKWRWSKTLTPGAENVFGDAPNFKVVYDKSVYKNFPANFDVNIKKYKKSKYKITWNFGDGHKSYQKTTTHKYSKNGKYKASVKIFNGSEEVIKEFKIEVKSFPKYDVEIIAVNPNPEGSDTDLETLTVRNNSKKKVDLQNWSIATGEKKLTNHPIALKTILKPKETLTITRALSKFTLNNKKAQVELRYPSGKVASKMKYDKKAGNIAEGEILEKSKLGWVWKNTAPVANVLSSFAEASEDRQENSFLAVASEVGENLETPQILGESDEKFIEANVPRVEHWVGEGMMNGGQSVGKNKKDFKVVLASFAYEPFGIN